jgi:hypothetical protein
MTNKPKAIGTAAETAVVRALRANGFPNAERRVLHGVLDQGDVTGTPGIAWEVKGGKQAKTASDYDIEIWIGEALAECDNAREDYGVLVVQRAGVGPANADRWWAYVTANTLTALNRCDEWVDDGRFDDSAPARLLLRDLLPILRRAGYGEPITQEATA